MKCFALCIFSCLTSCSLNHFLCIPATVKSVTNVPLTFSSSSCLAWQSKTGALSGNFRGADYATAAHEQVPQISQRRTIYNNFFADTATGEFGEDDAKHLHGQTTQRWNKKMRKVLAWGPVFLSMISNNYEAENYSFMTERERENTETPVWLEKHGMSMLLQDMLTVCH